MKLSVVLGGGILVAVSFMNLSAGVIGRCFYPELSGLPVDESLQTADAIFPVLVRDLAPWGLKGIVVAGLLAAAFSTYDSIGSTLSALVTRDVYARLLVKDRDDRHYMRFGQWITPVIILSSFAYLPFLQEKGMIFFYLDIVGAFVVPLLAVYLIGVFTRASPRSGSTALSVGVAYGVFTLTVDSPPAWLGGGSATSIVSLCLTSLTMLVITAFAGSWNGEGGQRDASGWLGRSAAEVEVSSEVQEDKRPLVFGLGLLSVIVVLCVWLW